MSTGAVYLRKWLNRSDQPTQVNLQFGIKAWQSIEFVCITKYQIITEEFCKNIPKLRKELLKKSNNNPMEYDQIWHEIINEFLGLKCSSGAVNSLTKQNLLLTLENEVMEILKINTIPNVHNKILDGLLLTFHNVAMQNYYKSYPDAYATFIAKILQLINRLLNVNGLNNELWLVEQVEKIKLIITALKLFVKQTPLIKEFRKSFSTEVIEPFSELMICLKTKYHQHDFGNDYFQIIQQLYFTTDSGSKLSSFLTKFEERKTTSRTTTPEDDIELDYYQLLMGKNIPLYCVSLIFEAIILSYRHDPDVLSPFLKYLFEKFYNQKHFTSLNNELLDNLSYVLNLLRKHDVNLNFEINNEKAIKFIGTYVEQLTQAHYETNLAEVIQLTISTLKLNPMMLEHTIIGIIVNFMVSRKDDGTLRIYEECMVAVLDVYRRLSRLEKFISQLIRSLWEKLTTIKLTKKIRKRKSIMLKNDDDVSEDNSGTPSRKKLKMIKDGGGNVEHGMDHLQEYSLSILKLLYNLISPTITSVNNQNQYENDSLWCEISFAWPSGIGRAFIKSISALVSKPSIVVWKTLLFTLTDYVNLLKDGNSDENSLFLIELTSTLLCQYFAGTRLAEQSDKQWQQIQLNCQTTHKLLHDFGTAILNQPHNIRTMNSFLKMCIHFGEFNLLLWYYCPDSINTFENNERNFQKSALSIHSYLHAKEWTLIEQRITNFGKNECKININKLYLQRFKASLLFDSSDSNNQSFRSSVLMIKNIEDDSTAAVQLLEILKSHETANLFIEHLTMNEKLNIAEIILKNYQIINGKLLKNILQNLEFSQVLFIITIKRLSENFSPIKSIFKSFDFDEIFNGGGGSSDVDITTIPILSNKLSKIIKKWCTQQQDEQQQTNIIIKKYSKDLLEEHLSILELINIDFADQNWKNLIFLLNLMLYCNLKATGEISLINRSILLIKEFLHFGVMPNIFEYINITDLSIILPLSSDNTSQNDVENEFTLAKDIYGIIFEKSTKNLNDENVKMFNELQKLMETNDKKLINIGFLLVQYLIKEKHCKQYYNQFRKIILKKIREYFDATDRTDSDDEIFVQQSLDVFCTVIATTLAVQGSDEISDIDYLKNIWTIYLNYSTNINNLCSIKLLNLTITHKIILNISENEIKSISDKHWVVFNEQLKSNTESSETMELFLKIILNQKTSEEFIDLLTENEESTDLINGFKNYQYKLFFYVAKCQLNKIKGSIFNEFFRQISLRLVMSLRCKSIITTTLNNSTNNTNDETVKSITEIPSNIDLILKLLECQRLICTNTQIPITANLVDDILSFLSEINIKKFELIDDNSAKIFVDIHTKMCEIMFTLIQNRHFFIADRVVQYVGIFRDLIQAVCCYKSNNTTNAVQSSLSNTTNGLIDGAEVSKLTELAHKLENIIKALVKFSKNVKRVAPYLLLFIINLVITNDRSTTLFPKIKTHFDAICYDLIAVCDHRVEGFIMRNCNEASRQIYEQLIKEYNKYHKFKGKV